MCIRKEGGLYRVGSKLYTHDEFYRNGCGVVLGLLFLTSFAVVIIATISEAISLNRIRASDDPATNLILALDKDHYWEDARRALDEIGDPLLLALAPACEGHAVGGTVYQDHQPGPHPLVFLLPDGKSHHLTYYYLKQWGPDSRRVEDVQLVVCAAEIEDEIEVCEYAYGGASRTRIQQKIALSVVEAATGRTYANHVFEGPVPKKCPTSVSNLDHKEIRGDEVDSSRITKYIIELFE